MAYSHKGNGLGHGKAILSVHKCFNNKNVTFCVLRLPCQERGGQARYWDFSFGVQLYSKHIRQCV